MGERRPWSSENAATGPGDDWLALWQFCLHQFCNVQADSGRALWRRIAGPRAAWKCETWHALPMHMSIMDRADHG